MLKDDYMENLFSLPRAGEGEASFRGGEADEAIRLDGFALFAMTIDFEPTPPLILREPQHEGKGASA